MSIERFVAVRYLRPRRGRGLVSVVSAIAVVGFAAGVAALVLALAVTNGFRDTLQQELVGATSDLNLLRKQPENFGDYRRLMDKLANLPHVRALAPVVYDEGLLTHFGRSSEVVIKGVVPAEERRVGDVLNRLASGTWQPLERDPSGHNLVLGYDLAASLALSVGQWVQLYVPNAVLLPTGPAGRTLEFRVVGIFQSGFSDFDSRWAFTSMRAAQQIHAREASDRVSAIEFRLNDIYAAEQVAKQAQQVAGPEFVTSTWIEQNRALFRALKLEQLGTIIVIGLVVFVAAMNVLIMLTMLVMEKRKEIAVLMSLGTRQRQIRRIFILQGVLIDLFGTAVGLVFAYTLAWAADRYRWIPLSAEVYAINYVPFHAHAVDGVLVAILALLITYFATLYPSSRAAAVVPAETLRYE